MTTAVSPHQWRIRIDTLIDHSRDYERVFRILDLLLMYRHQASVSSGTAAAHSARIGHLQTTLAEWLDDHDRADANGTRRIGK